MRNTSGFIGKLKFGNALPSIPFDPKLLALPVDPSRHCHYHTTSLETSYQHVLHTEPDLGIPLNLIDPEVYKVKQPKPPLGEEDTVILDIDVSAPASKTLRRGEALRPSVSWLRKHTEYISNDLSEISKKSKREHPESKVGYASKKKGGKEGKRKRADEEVVEAIERGFERAKKPPVHPTNPQLTPVEIIPVFPDFDLWGNTYSQVVFDADPAPEVTLDTQGQPALQEELELRAVVKGFSAGQGNEKQSFVSYIAPKLCVDEQTGISTPSDCDYQWLREYVYRVDPKVDNSYFFVWSSAGAYYNNIASKVILDKIKTKAAKKSIQEQGRPDNIQATTRHLLEEEKRAQEERIQILQPT